MVDIGAELFAMSASVSRAALLRDQDPERGRSAEQLADAFCRQSRQRTEELFRRAVEQHRHAGPAPRPQGAGRGLRLAGGGVLDASEGTGPWIAEWSAPGADLPDQRWPYGTLTN